MVQEKLSWKQEPENGDHKTDDICINDSWFLWQKALGDSKVTVGHSELHRTPQQLLLLLFIGLND